MIELDNDTNEQQNLSTATRLMLIATNEVTLSKTPDGEAYAHVPARDGWQTFPVEAKGFKNWLRLRYYATNASVPNKAAVDAACEMLTAKAIYEGATEQVYVRLAWRANEQALYLNLGPDVGVVRVTADGWGVCETAPVRFRWPNAALPLPRPERGGKLGELRKLLNIESEDDWVLLVSFLVGMYHPTGPYPTLHLLGEKGCAKSSTSRYLRSLFDPSTATAVKQPRDAEAVMLKAYNNAVVAFDNLSYMPEWLSDLICQINTGASDSKRAHYANVDEVILSAKRPVILNGIGEIVSKGDLLDRLISVQLPVIPPSKRRTEAELDAAFAAAQPRILGALLDVVSAALRHRDQVQLAEKPRMADFAVWVKAAEEALGWKPDTFLTAYKRNAETGAATEIEQSLVAQAVLRFMRGHEEYEAPAERLLVVLEAEMGEAFTRRQGWPKTGASLSRRLMQVAGALRTQGVDVVRDREGKSRSIYLRTLPTEHQDQEADDGSDANDAISPKSPISSPKEEKREEGQEGVGQAAQMPSFASQASHARSCSHPIAERSRNKEGRLYCGACFLYLDFDRHPARPFAPYQAGATAPAYDTDEDEAELPF